MGQLRTQTRLVIAGIVLFGIVTITACLQPILHLNTYLALAICMIDTIVVALFLFDRQE